MTRNILYAYSSTVMKDNHDEKTEVLRAEFMEMIVKSRENLLSKRALEEAEEKS
jgi:hypothetical protein